MSSAQNPDLTPGPDGSTPEQAVPVKDVLRTPAPVYFNFIVHEAVQKMKGLGLWVQLPAEMGAMKVRLRPFYHHQVVIKQEEAERIARLNNRKLADDKPLPGNDQIAVNRSALLFAITDAEGYINVGAPGIVSEDPDILAQIEGTHKALAAAVAHHFEVIEREGGLSLIHLTPLLGKVSAGEREEQSLRVREVMRPLLESSMGLMNQLFKTSKELQTVEEKEVYEKGEAYVFGQAGALSLRD